MSDWWNRPAPGEGWEFQIDPETGRGGWRYREHLLLAPIRGVVELWHDLRRTDLGLRHWFALGVLVGIIKHLGG